ncbi:MAG: hypothetical protein GWN01_03725, partial [Nitrosopumilaceae archaeon]|nr:carboxypeptidase-like regulatory domain-containing protein [Nitrosopumilaceae archaeon]NIU86445.1 hypothetical protein [Nitrosopumilaceae archaeon]NIV65154.1 hypothetical protein [Nitrosopumilaceae archaeon]NIX60668.1 hypothetical protein [Nitrosopumilaceae archaeon]
EFATLYNLSKKTSCITDEKGFFNLEAQVNDSVEIRHLSYKKQRFLIDDKYENFTLSAKDYQIEEVLVSPQFAFQLFNKSCLNTWNTFKEENISRAYCRSNIIGNNWVAQTFDLDLDIVQKKRNTGRERINSFIIQERTESNEAAEYADIGITLNFFYPLIHQIYWVNLPKEFNYYKSDYKDFISLRLINKKTYDYPV